MQSASTTSSRAFLDGDEPMMELATMLIALTPDVLYSSIATLNHVARMAAHDR